MNIYMASSNLHLFELLIITTYLKNKDSILIVDNSLKESHYLNLFKEDIDICFDEFDDSFYKIILQKNKNKYAKYDAQLLKAENIYLCNPMHSICSYFYNHSKSKYFMLDDGLASLNLFPEIESKIFKIKYFTKNILRELLYKFTGYKILGVGKHIDYLNGDDITFIALHKEFHNLSNIIPLQDFYNEEINNKFNKLKFNFTKPLYFLSYHSNLDRLQDLNTKYSLIGHPRIDYNSEFNIMKSVPSEIIIRHNDISSEASSLIIVFLFWKDIDKNENSVFIKNPNIKIRTLFNGIDGVNF